MAPDRRRVLRSRGRQIAAGVIAAAAFGTLWLYFAPSQLGGGATYSITDGTSMEPLLHANDLALVRAQSTYKVGDVVLYQSSTIHRPVLHRILVIQDGRYFFKGDHNGFVDPGYATRSELTGKLWLHVGSVGGVLGWIGKPSHTGLLAGLTALLLLLGGVATAGRRRRRRRGGGGLRLPGAPSAHARRYMMPVGRATLTSLVVLATLGLLLVGVGFTTPSQRTVPLQDAYRHTGNFSYFAKADKPSVAYPSGIAITGDPLFTSLVNSTTLRFQYRFVSTLPHRVHGTIELKGLILSQASSWQSLYAVEARSSFTGDVAETGGPVELKALYTLLNQVAAASGISGSSYSVDIQPLVHVVGTVGGTPIDSTFSPVIPFTVAPAATTLDAAPTATPPGATYVPQTGNEALAAVVRPVQSGSIPVRAANLVTIARYEVPVSALRVLGLIALALAIVVAVLHDLLLRRHSRLPEEEQIAAHFGSFVTPVDDLALRQGAAPTLISDFASLARLARYLERPILRQSDETGRTYTVDDETRVYHYRAAPASRALPEKAPSAVVVRSRGRTGRRPRILVAGAVLVLVVAITLVTSFTASTNVPTSRASVSSQSRQLTQLTPSGCSSLALTTLAVHTGAYTNYSSHVLILGGPSTQTITDYGGYNCVVGGGGSDTVNGASSDVCIRGPGSGTHYYYCTVRS